MSLEPSSKLKCKLKKRKSVTWDYSILTGKREDHEMEGTIFSSLRTERDRVRYIKIVADKKLKVREGGREGGIPLRMRSRG